MKEKQLNRIMRLVRNTGDRLVILDKESDETMVMMNLDEYENLLGSNDDYDCGDACDCDDDCGCGNDCDCFDTKDTITHEPEHNAEEWDEEWIKETPASSDIKDMHMPDEELVPMEDFGNVEPLVSEPVIAPLPTHVPMSNNPGRVGGMSSLASILQEEPLGDVPHEEEEEPFLLEPVE